MYYVKCLPVRKLYVGNLLVYYVRRDVRTEWSISRVAFSQKSCFQILGVLSTPIPTTEMVESWNQLLKGGKKSANLLIIKS